MMLHIAAFGLITAASLDFCADQYLLALAEPAEIVALSPGADEDDSYLREKARGIHKARPAVEEIAPLKPDIVFRFWGGAPRMSEILSRFGGEVVTLAYPENFDIVRANIGLVAEKLGRPERGAALLADLDRRLAALARRPPTKVVALYVTPGGVTAGRHTMIDAIFSAAGVRNAASENDYWPAFPAETLLRRPPQLIVTGFFEATTEYVNHWSATGHPAFRKAFAQTPSIHLPADIVSCPAWFAVDAAEMIADEAARL
ncbi:MAG: ABC transporter substrate-binding protein [Amphiplicatus sp.]